MTETTRITRHGILGLAMCAGLGLATLTTQAQAKHCMMNKPYGQTGYMGAYGPHHYTPMKKHGYGNHGYHGMHKYKDMHGKHGGYGAYGSYGESASAYGKESRKTEQPAAAASSGHTASSDASGLDIIETAAAAQNFSTLIRAAEAAGLYDVLRGDGPFTVFAPSDAAFENLPAGTVEALLADREKLTAVLTYHVVPERLTAADLVQQREFTTVQGQTLSLDKLSVALADIEASNGIIHVIDTVLIPAQ